MGLEQTSLAQAMILALGGSVLGFGVAYVLFYWSIGRKYGPIKAFSNHAKIKYWCGLTTTIFFGLGLSTILNEFLSAHFHEKEIAVPAIERGIFTAIAPVLVVVSVAFLLLKTRRDDIQATQLHSESAETAATGVVRENKRNLILLAAVATIAVIAAQAAWLTDFTRKTKDFRLIGCYSCDKENTCISSDPLPTGFRVNSPDIYLFFKSDGQSRISKFPVDNEMKCIIVKDRNFAFDCFSSAISGGMLMKLTVVFDGESSFYYDSSTLAAVNGVLLTRNKVTCVAK